MYMPLFTEKFKYQFVTILLFVSLVKRFNTFKSFCHPI